MRHSLDAMAGPERRIRYLDAIVAVFVLAVLLLSPILRIVRDYQLSSLADLFAFRYHSQATGVLVTVLMLAAAFLLPRQFHMTFSEALNERSLLAASWAFPLFLLLLNLFIPVILWAGLVLQPGTPPDFYVPGITLSSEFRLLPYIAFIGGLSAASAMMIVTTLALASMCLNHLVLPVSSYPDPA